MKIFFRVDASKKIGSGHVIRCVTLAKELEKRGAYCIFLSRDHDGNLFDYITANGFELKILNNHSKRSNEYRHGPALFHSDWLSVSQSSDAAESIQLIDNQNPDWIVVDHYGIDFRWHELLRPHCKKIFVIDDLDDREHDCDLLLDQNLVKNHFTRYENKVARKVPKLLGPRFALLQREYLDLKHRVPVRHNKIARVLVYFGGSDLHNLTESIVDALVEKIDDNVTVDVVTNQPVSTLIKKINSNKNFKLHSNLPSLAPLMLKADLAIGAGGATTWERCFMGLPCIVVTTAENQIAIAKEMHEQGLIFWLGHFSAVKSVHLPSKIEKILLDLRIISASSKKCMNLLDGLGANRVAQIMLLDESTELMARSVSINDEELLLELRNDSEDRSNSFSPDIVNPKNHNLWFNKILKYPEIHELFIVETIDGLPIGQVRFDKKNENWESSYSLFPYARRKNLGKKVLSTALKNFLKNKSRVKIYARVKSENLPSQKVLENNSFQAESHGGGKLSISICTHLDSWSSKFVAELIYDWINHGHSVVWVNDHTLLSAGDVCFYLSYDKLVDLDTLNKFSNNLVAHASDLPNGKGWSPLSWQILEGESIITVTLLEANSEIDSGPVYVKQQINLSGHELLPDLQNTVSRVIYEMCEKFIANYPESAKVFSEQTGTSTYYKKRSSKDSELDINQTLGNQFNLLRIVDNEKYPAFFRIGDNTYILKISKQDLTEI